MKKREYLNALCRLLSPEEIKKSAENPTTYMSETHIKLHFIALRKLNREPK